MDIAESSDEYNSRLGSGTNVVFLTKDDWGSKDHDLEFTEQYFIENADFLKRQKAFIYNGVLYVNTHNAGIGDLVHE
jgi:hypothetical protein